MAPKRKETITCAKCVGKKIEIGQELEHMLKHTLKDSHLFVTCVKKNFILERQLESTNDGMQMVESAALSMFMVTSY